MIYIAPCQSVWPGLVVNPVKTAPYFLVLSRLFVMSHSGFFFSFFCLATILFRLRPVMYLPELNNIYHLPVSLKF